MKFTMKTLPLSVAVLLAPLAIASANDTGLEGSATIELQSKHVTGNEAKFDEYGSASTEFSGALDLGYDKNGNFLQFTADGAYSDNYNISLEGGSWEKFKANLYFDRLPHNITFDAKTMYSGAGTSTLTLTGDPANVSTWLPFDYSTKRDRSGGGLSIDAFKPFFLDISARQDKKDGIMPTGYGNDSFVNFVELPGPIAYKTDAMRVEAGYSKKPFFAALSYDYSKFTNTNPELDFDDPFVAATPNSVAQSPDNDDYKLAFKGSVFLPYNSKFNLNTATGRTSSELVENGILGYGAFSGKIDTKNLDLSLTTNPIATVDGKLFYKYYDRDNQTDSNSQYDISLDPLLFPAYAFGYTNDSFGARVGVKLPAHLRLTAGYTNATTKYQDRFDATKRDDDTYSAGLAWSGWDMATFKLAYERLHRDSERDGTLAASYNDNLWRFDVAPADRDTYTASVDLSPLDELSLTLGYKYKVTNYTDSALPPPTGSIVGLRALGLRDSKTDQVFVDASYAFGKKANLYGYFDYERLRSVQYAFSYDDLSDWTLGQREQTYDYGLGVDFFVIPKKLTVKAKYDYTHSDGSQDFAYLDSATPADSDIGSWGNYRKTALSLRAIYDLTERFTITGGYAYEELSTDDILFNDYQYLPAGPTSYLTGAYSDPSYRANVVFASLTCRF